MREAVTAQYPETEASVPEVARMGTIPASMLEALQQAAAESQAAQESKEHTAIHREKGATPGGRAMAVDAALEEARPHAVCLDVSANACSDPASLRESALARYGDLHVTTGQSSFSNGQANMSRRFCLA